MRALCGLPLGEPRAHSASVMVNLLGDLWYDGDTYREPDWAKLYAIPNLKLHLYGKHHARPGRKMGHFTVIGDNAEQVQKPPWPPAPPSASGTMTPPTRDYQRAVDLLVAGELVAIPTETVLRPGADAANPAVAKILPPGPPGRPPADRPSGRPRCRRPLGRAGATVAWELMETFWPGPLTLILKSRPGADAVTGGQDTVGLRVPGHPVALELLRRFARAKGESDGKCRHRRALGQPLRPHQPDHRRACRRRLASACH